MSLNYPLDDEIFIFSSHAWKYLNRRDGLTDLISSHWIKGEDYFDLSVTPRHPIDAEGDPELAYELRERVRVCDALLVTAGMFVNDKPWIRFEIHMAFALDRPIIPVVFNGQERVPQAARQFASCEPVKWRGDSIRDAILRFLPPHRRQAFEAKLARREAARAEARREAVRRAMIASVLLGTRRPPASLAVRTLMSPPPPPRPTIMSGGYRTYADYCLPPALPPRLPPRGR